MTIAQRLRKARACVDVAKSEVKDLRNLFLYQHVECFNEARALSVMQGQLKRMAARLENMARHHDALANL